MILVNERTKETVASVVTLAVSRAERRRGLLGRDSLDPSAAMILAPCFSVHTVFMRFPIDVAFVDRDGYAVKIVRRMVPWRLAAAPRAQAVIELAAGGLEHVMVGDRLALTPSATGDRAAPGSLRGLARSLRPT